MPSRLSRPNIIIAKIAHHLIRLRADQRGTIAVMMGFLLPVMIGGLGIAFEISSWYRTTRAMQNAADAAAIAAAANGTTAYGVEARLVAANYNFNDGVNNVTVTPDSGTDKCPAGLSIASNPTPTCYRVRITSVVPLYLTQVVGYSGDNAGQKTLQSEAIAVQTEMKQPVCLLGLDQTPGSTAVTSNGGPNTNFTGCTVMSNSNGRCNGSDLQAYMGIAAGTNGGGAGCGNIQYSGQPPLADPYAKYADNIRTDLNNLRTKCSGGAPNYKFPQWTKQGNKWSGGNTWANKTVNVTGTDASTATVGNNLICGDVMLTTDVTLHAPNGEAVLYFENGRLDLNGHNLTTDNGSAVSIVFTGDANPPNGTTYNHYWWDNTNNPNTVLDINAAKTGPFPGMALYQDPQLPAGSDVDIKSAGASPTLRISGGVYLPEAQVTISGAIDRAIGGAQCLVMVAKDITINGTGSLYAQTPDGSGCKNAGLEMPMATVPSRGQLVY
jgi:Flp pilus assembly protein TadG